MTERYKDDPTRVCYSLFQRPRVGAISLSMLVFAVLQLLLSLLILAWLRRQRRLAGAGERAAGQRLVLPVYIQILVALALCNACTGAAMALLPLHVADDSTPWYTCLVMALAWGGYHWTLEGLAYLLIQRGAGSLAQSRANRFGLTAAAFTAICVFVFYRWGATTYGVVALSFWNVVLASFYGAVWLLPASVLYRRPAAYSYARFFFVVRIVDLAGAVGDGWGAAVEIGKRVGP